MGALNSMSLTEAGWLIPYLLVAISLTFSLSAALNIMVLVMALCIRSAAMLRVPVYWRY